MRLGRVRLALAGAALAAAQPAFSETVELAVPVVRQQTNVWCWAATSSMLLELYGYPNVNPGGNFQCGYVAVVFPECDASCWECIRPIGPLPNMKWALDRYLDYVRERHDFFINVIQPRYEEYPSFSEIKESLSGNYPVIAGISPAGPPADASQAQHAVLISGFIDEYWGGERRRLVIINDPFIYEPGQNPYERAGSSVHLPTGKAVVDWEVFRDELNFTSAVFVNPQFD